MNAQVQALLSKCDVEAMRQLFDIKARGGRVIATGEWGAVVASTLNELSLEDLRYIIELKYKD